MTFRELILKPLTRSAGWRKARAAHLAANPKCAVCGRLHSPEVHHIEPFSDHPELELDPANLITLCSGSTKCHFTFGHLGNWRGINTHVRNDCAYMGCRFAEAPKC